MKIGNVIDIYGLMKIPYFVNLMKKFRIKLSAEIFIVVITGGPCGGKTSLVSLLKRRFFASEISQAFFASEAATCLKNDHIDYHSAGQGLTFQYLILKHQLTAEMAAVMTAIIYKSQHPEMNVYAIFDRSIMDGQGYVKDKKTFDKILAYEELTTEMVYARSDIVIHLVTAAVGALFAYTTSDGTPRDEKPEDAAKLDFKIREAWSGHPNFEVLENTFKFDQKLSKAMSIIFNMTGTKIPYGLCKRFIVPIPSSYGLQTRTKHLQTHFDKTLFLLPEINSPNNIRSLRVRKSEDNITYQLNVQRWEYIPNPETGALSEEATYDVTTDVTKDEASKLIMEVNSQICPLDRMVYSFYLTDAIYCELSTFNCNDKYAYLKVTFENSKDKFEEDYKILQSFFPTLREVTFERRYSEYYIAESNGKCLNPPI